MLRTCRPWRSSLSADSNRVWEVMVYKRFPRMVEIMRILPPTSPIQYMKLYRDQLRAEAMLPLPPKRAPCPTCNLSDFVFSATLKAGGSQFSCSAAFEDPAILELPIMPSIAALDALALNDLLHEFEIVSLHVTRRMHGQLHTVMLVKNCQQGEYDIDEDGLHTFSIPLPSLSGGPVFDSVQFEPEIRFTLTTEGTLALFLEYHEPHVDYHTMSDFEYMFDGCGYGTLHFLEYDLPWDQAATPTPIVIV